MNIQQAMEQIRGAARAYLSKDENGIYRIPRQMQRPIIILGPPGVGKTAVVAQVAAELGINYVSYSITHHTRQTALGLPYIVEREYGGRTYQVSEYTMSEIIGAVHEARKRSGVPEGILFLDEVNCVSETLAPAMLQFLQYKTFGQHRLPDGWIIVTAGNPPEYNRSARDFDPAMLDRLKRIEVEPDASVWLEYASAHRVHPAIIGFVEAKPSAFYLVRAGVKGMRLVTARGWEDLSRILLACDAEGLSVDEELVSQYLQDDETAADFAVHYGVYRMYKDEYRVTEVLDGVSHEALAKRAAVAGFGERMAVVGLMADAVSARVHDTMALERALMAVRADIVAHKPALDGGDLTGLHARAADLEASLSDRGEMADTRLLADQAIQARLLVAIVRAAREAAAREASVYEAVRDAYNAECSHHAALLEQAECGLDNAYAFLDAAFGADGQDTLVFTTRLSSDPQVTSFAARHSSASFRAHNKGLLIEDRKQGLLGELRLLEG